MLVNVDILHPRTASADHLQGFAGAARWGRCAGLAGWLGGWHARQREGSDHACTGLPTFPATCCPCLADHGRSPHVSKPVKTLVHPGEVNRMREVPQHPHVLVTHTDAPHLFVWNTDTQPDRTGVKVCALCSGAGLQWRAGAGSVCWGTAP